MGNHNPQERSLNSFTAETQRKMKSLDFGFELTVGLDRTKVILGKYTCVGRYIEFSSEIFIVVNAIESAAA